MSSKAVYAHGKVVTGITHGDAFGKLSQDEQGGNDFLIGSWCQRTGRFTDGNTFFYTKKILMVRHGTPECGYDVDPDPHLSPEGVVQVDALGDYLHDVTEWEHCPVFCSPLIRCVETAMIISELIGSIFSVDKDLVEQSEGETPESMLVRIEHVFEKLPERSVVISHCGFIRNAVEYVRHDDVVNEELIPTASMTLVDHQNVVCVGEEVSRNLIVA